MVVVVVVASMPLRFVVVDASGVVVATGSQSPSSGAAVGDGSGRATGPSTRDRSFGSDENPGRQMVVVVREEPSEWRG